MAPHKRAPTKIPGAKPAAKEVPENTDEEPELLPAMTAGSPARAVEVIDVDSVVDAAAAMAESVLAEYMVEL